ncbi:pyridoxal phosphate-dependent transferase [Parachaetomium inaequale]|uniref:Pyridoxal phosphate-dependent transferase n=1 Tax=Parachaetomium inaequale TaxID=2588326 RepID=A0AAN6SS89_9PEZI|nr:pyridoxal phosphate-dependent transferase [Parachaetomium inaequale]
MSEKGSPLDQVLASLLDRRRARNQLRRLTTVPNGTVDFSSNAYLSLSTQSVVQQAFLARLEEAASTTAAADSSSRPSLLGSGGSRLLDGNSAYAESLECTLAAFHGAQAGLLFNSAMDANVGLFSCVPQPGDAIVYDALIHASVHDGIRLSRASRRLPFAHSRIWEESRAAGTAGLSSDTSSPAGESLEAVLRSLLQGPEGALFQSGERNVFIAVEGVYSMDGDVAPLVDIVDCVERCLGQGNGYVIVDEAHSTGIFGDCGRGLVCELGLERRVWARVLGFGKAVGCAGGMVLCSSTTRSYLINYARTLIYTTAMAFPSLASIETAYDFLATGQARPLLSHLRLLVQETHRLLLAACARHCPPAEVLRVSIEQPRSPIIPVFTSKPRDLAAHCQRSGFMVRPIVAPTVPKGDERIRVCLHAGNTMGEVEGLVAAVEAWLSVILKSGAQCDESTALEEETQDQTPQLAPPNREKAKI